eukprot:3834542-Rhodomonas_salina.4
MPCSAMSAYALTTQLYCAKPCCTAPVLKECTMQYQVVPLRLVGAGLLEVVVRLFAECEAKLLPGSGNGGGHGTRTVASPGVIRYQPTRCLLSAYAMPAMSLRDVWYLHGCLSVTAMLLRACDAMSGTDLAYGATMSGADIAYSTSLSAYALTSQCPVVS